jgi:hypothetical protein
MFAMKNMDKHLRLKLDMVYRNLSTEEAQKRYDELTAPPPVEEAPPAEAAEEPAPPPKPKTKIKRSVVKTIKSGKE